LAHFFPKMRAIILRTLFSSPLDLYWCDCEGSGSTTRGPQHDARLFALAAALSAVFVNNVRGGVEEGGISGVAGVAEMAKYVKNDAEMVSNMSKNRFFA
jgi:hypothetical protein